VLVRATTLVAATTHLGCKHILEAWARKWRLAREEFDQQDSERVDVCFLRVVIGGDDLGCHVDSILVDTR